MDGKTLFLAFIALLGWGGGSFIAKLGTNRIGATSSIFWDMVGYTIVAAAYAFIVYSPAALLAGDKVGIVYALLSGATGAVAGVAFFILLAQKDASSVVPLTAIYPALTAILAFLFLKESLTWTKVLGIVFATLAVYLLSL